MFANVEYFSEAAKDYKKNGGHYTLAPYGSKDYKQYWREQIRRCKEGYTVAGTTITNYHYWFLNFCPMNIVKDPKKKASEKIWGFPRFFDYQHDFFHHLKRSEEEGKHLVLLKPRGTGFSEIFAAVGMNNYTLFERSKSFYFAYNEGFLNKDGVLTKAWDKMEFLNQNTDRAFKHLRQGKNQDLHKKASYYDSQGNERGSLSEIIGRVIDHPRKVRGARTGSRGKVYFEEGGSFPNLLEAVAATRPLVEQGGIATGQIVVWGTGGEQGPGIEGLETLFYNPEAHNFYAVDNVWDDDMQGTTSGYFFPAYTSMDRYMDDNGNCDHKQAQEYHLGQRKLAAKDSPEAEDRYIAEYPFSPKEALMRLSSNLFPVAELQRQLTRVRGDKNIQGLIKYGDLVTKETGEVTFQLLRRPEPLKTWPIKERKLDGCFAMVEAPYKDGLGQTPEGLYQVLVDPYYKDESTSTSVGAIYVYKYRNDVSPTQDDIVVGWYVGRLKSTTQFYRLVFQIAKFYNAKIQSEISGGGQGLLDYARERKLLHMCDYQPLEAGSAKEITKASSRTYFMKTPGEYVRLAHTYFADWLLTERELKQDNGEITSVLNLHKIYDEGLLEELIKFNDEANFDRVSAMRMLPFMIKENVDRVVQERMEKNTFWDRPFFTDRYMPSPQNQMSYEDLKNDIPR